MSEPDDVSRGLPATSWAVLGMLTFGEELTGNDLKKWADWSVGFFYWSPSISQVYAELKKLESIGFVESRVVSEPGVRGKRLYSITQSGTDAVRTWSREAPVEVPVLKHGVMLRLWMGHLNEPERLKALVEAHIANVEEQIRRAKLHADHAENEPAWSFPVMTLRWSERYFRAEIELARELLEDIDRASAEFANVAEHDRLGSPLPSTPGRWKNVEEYVLALEQAGLTGNGSNI
ncbi:PadR family transcriptional regulator [Rhodococcus erythropolis]|jgi:DNA-binding PadR family transcriptional regulator|uniref:Helix-turn-helix transcriptional regulator n=4 Tax=Rhodococcus erythropolis group TaxID=2840174 RepID=A0A401N290_RHOER|nr:MULTISPECIES: PadR family transcriptional regulator [Rhodococcus]ERB54374.1 PadR family transcriptional regulator [Rhodococcus sp. P27]MCD2153605.1 PadR family transcriptional regulator [Rhodococcus cerastii]MCW0189881.1 PadR family transcriptional regulator [Rhodococcus sp. (in: high G+C Gram-positive bacteria)]NHP14848.1 PadR family transcriptional regulator [Rhodococcus sp. IC4_135]ALU72495.1 PadR family transcriptional regulator [Rhodococcus erythropolis R138]